jgi:HAD superfamily hydrolase (TIGR01509 family)
LAHNENSLAAVLFDMDGTLVDTENTWWQAVAQVAASLGYPLTDADLLEVLGQPVEHTAAHLVRATGTSTTFAALTAELHREFAARVRELVVPQPGAMDLLDQLRDHDIAIALVSASTKTIVDIVLKVLDPKLFSVTITADDVQYTKPAPDPYLAAARGLDVAPSNCVAIEDTQTGVTSAEAAGCHVVAVPSLAPIPPTPGRTVLESLKQVDVALLRALVAGHQRA